MKNRRTAWRKPIFAGLAALASVAAQAGNVLTVTSSGDGLSGPGCTLRMAVTAANTGSRNACGQGTGNNDIVQLGGPGATNIILAPNLGAIAVTGSMTIQGNYQGAHPDYATVTISTTGGALLQVPGSMSKDVTLTMKWLRLTGAHGNSGSGGCLGVNRAAAGNMNTTNLTTVQIDHCSAWSGGAVYAAGELDVTSSSFHDNHASFGGAVTMDGSGGASAGGGFTLVAKSTTFSANAADQNGGSGLGGAVYIMGGTDRYLNDFANISATGSTFSGNRAPNGGGIYSAFGHIVVDGTTFDSNSATVDGGGFYIKGGGGVFMHNSTFGKNSATRNGGGIYHDGNAGYWEASYITVAQNSAGNCGGGLYEAANGGGTKNEGDNIYAYNTAAQGADLWGDFTYWVGPDIVLAYAGTPPSNFLNIDPQLAKFQSVNGLPKVYPLLPGSVAIDGGSGGVPYDQRGGCRPLGSGYDLGAFEYDSASTYLLVSVNSGMALDDPGSSHTAGQQMEQWTVNDGSNQAWSINLQQRNRLGGILRLVNQASGQTLGVRGGSTASGAAVEQNVWTGGDYQQWAWFPSTPDYLILNNARSGQALDVIGASTSAGALIDQWPQNGGANQKWSVLVRPAARCYNSPY
ncbi:MAG: RICIN domain-containing protein [Fibrobacteres bacterium]|nr:RICIN domain-containing protein [Fibrobacterota bacterium]